MRSTHPSPNDRPLVRSIRLDEPALHKLLDQLEAAEMEHDSSRRLSKRYPFRAMNIVLHLQQPGDGIAQTFRCPTRNLSKGGISILHGGFVHQGSRCLVQLMSSPDPGEPIAGTVVGCRYIQANVHEVHIRFDRRVDTAVYCVGGKAELTEKQREAP